MRFGEFETVRELNQGGAETIYSARRVGETGEPRFAVRALQVPAFVDEADARRRTQAFLRSAQIQKKAAESAGAASHWAPIHGSPAPMDGGAFYVTDLYARSADDLSTGRQASADPGELWRIADSIVRGLLELDVALARPHGNLKPGNVLISGRRERLTAALADPLDDDAAARRAGLAGDLRALGDVLHRLVAHAPPPDGGTVADGPQWSALGPAGGKWRGLCSRLLGGGGPFASLDETLAAISALAPPGRAARRRLTFIGMGSAAAVLAAIILVPMFWRAHCKYSFDPGEWQAVCQEWAWLGRIEDPGVLHAMDGDPYLKHVAGEVRQQGPGLLAPQTIAHRDASANPRILATLRPAGADQCESRKSIHDTLQLIEQVKRELSPSQWKVRARLDQRIQQAGEARRDVWEPVKEALADLDNFDKGPTAESLGLVLEAKGWSAKLDMADADAGRLKAAAPAGDAPDPVYLALAARIQVAAGYARFDDLDQLHGCALQLLSVGSSGFARGLIRQDLSIRTAGELGTNASPGAWNAAVQGWLAAARKDYRLLPAAEDPRHTPQWLAKLKTIDATIAQVNLKGDSAQADAANLRQQRDGVDRQIQSLTRRQAIARNRDDLLLSARAVQAGLDALESRVRQTQARYDVNWDQWLPMVRQLRASLPSGSAALETLWETRRGRLLGNFPTDVAGRFNRKGRIEALQAAVEQIDRDAPPVDLAKSGPLSEFAASEWLRSLRELAGQEREQILSGAAQTAQWTPAGWAGSGWAPAEKKWNDLRLSIQDLAAQTAALAAWISPAGGMYTPPEALPGGQTLGERYNQWSQLSLMGDPAFEHALAAPKALLGRLVHGLDTPQARHDALALNDDPDAALVLEAWRTSTDLPLDQEEMLRGRLDGWTARIVDPVRRRQLDDEISVERGRRWARRMGNPGSFAEVALGEKLRIPWNVKNGVLNDSGRYNEQLWRLTESARQGKWKDDEAARRAKDFIEQVPGTLRGQPAIASVTKQIETLLADAKRKVATPQQQELAGPEDIDWKKVDPSRVVSDAYKLEFRPVQTQAGEVYLATTETSVEQFAQILARHPWAQARQQLSDLFKDLPTAGPRVWALADGSLVPASAWIAPMAALPQNALPFKLARLDQHMQTPRLQHPIQYIPFEMAAACARAARCRLPTIEEWTAALKQETDLGKPLKWNLRDNSLKAQADYYNRQLKVVGAAGALAISGMSPESWNPFVPEDAPTTSQGVWNAARTKPASSGAPGAYDDGHLFFNTVVPDPSEQPPPGRLFYHLEGNVAEFVDDKSGNPFVIGGSALSPPELPLDAPLTLPQTDRGYVDVGFRLAFPAPTVSVVARLKQILANPPVAKG